MARRFPSNIAASLPQHHPLHSCSREEALARARGHPFWWSEYEQLSDGCLLELCAVIEWVAGESFTLEAVQKLSPGALLCVAEMCDIRNLEERDPAERPYLFWRLARCNAGLESAPCDIPSLTVLGSGAPPRTRIIGPIREAPEGGLGNAGNAAAGSGGSGSIARRPVQRFHSDIAASLPQQHPLRLCSRRELLERARDHTYWHDKYDRLDDGCLLELCAVMWWVGDASFTVAAVQELDPGTLLHVAEMCNIHNLQARDPAERPYLFWQMARCSAGLENSPCDMPSLPALRPELLPRTWAIGPMRGPPEGGYIAIGPGADRLRPLVTPDQFSALGRLSRVRVCDMLAKAGVQTSATECDDAIGSKLLAAVWAGERLRSVQDVLSLIRRPRWRLFEVFAPGPWVGELTRAARVLEALRYCPEAIWVIAPECSSGIFTEQRLACLSLMEAIPAAPSSLRRALLLCNLTEQELEEHGPALFGVAGAQIDQIRQGLEGYGAVSRGELCRSPSPGKERPQFSAEDGAEGAPFMATRQGGEEQQAAGVSRGPGQGDPRRPSSLAPGEK